MKRLLTSGIAVVMAAMAGTARADEPYAVVFEGQYPYGGLMPMCISANGKYVAGSSFAQVGFISDWKNQNTLVCDGQNGHPRASSFDYVTNNGVAMGGTLINFETGRTQFMLAGGYVDMMTEDGSIYVGMTPNKEYSDFGSPHNIEYQACYWENGRMHLLPVPTEEELGYYYLRTRARCISSDGSVILGEIVDRLYLLPMILWRRQADGSYELDAVCKDYFSDIKYNEGYYKEYVTFQGCALSRNGKWVPMILRESPEYGKPATKPLKIGLYNVETGEIQKAIIKYALGVAPTPRYSIYYNGVSDDGTVVGYYDNDFGGESSFIMRRDDMTPVRFTQEFDSIGLFADFEDWGSTRVSAITPDGRYICGYGWLEDYTGFVLDRGVTDAEYAAAKGEQPDPEDPADPEDPTDPSDPADPENPDDSSVGKIGVETGMNLIQYYDISGRRLERPAKGLNIVRHPNGVTEKVVL